MSPYNIVYVPLGQVRKEWLGTRGRGIEQLRCLGQHSHIYDDVFGFEFRPLGFLWVVYPDGYQVTWGDLIPAKHALLEPRVTLPGNLRGDYATLLLTNPDAHLQDSTQELLHWMV